MPKRKATKKAEAPRTYKLLRYTPLNNELLMSTPSWPTMAVHEAERLKLAISKTINFEPAHG